MEFPWGGVSRRVRLGILIFSLAATFGCGGDTGPARIAVTGSVDLEGRAAGDGRLTFLPEVAGLSTASTRVTGGRYAFNTSDGPAAGVYTVGYEPDVQASGGGGGKQSPTSRTTLATAYVARSIQVVADGTPNINLDMEPGDPFAISP